MTSAVRNTTIPTLAPPTALPKKMPQQVEELAQRILQEPSLKAYEELARHNIWDMFFQVEVCNKRFSQVMCCSYVLEHLPQDASFPFDLLLQKLERVKTIAEKVIIRGQETSVGDCIAQLLPWQPPAADKQKAARSWQILGQRVGSHQTIQTSSGQSISAAACFVKSIELNPKDKAAWLSLIGSMSPTQTVTIYGMSFSCLDCCSKAIQLNPNEWQVWLLISELLDQTQTITLLGREYHATDCIAHVLSEHHTDDPTLSLQAWLLLGRVLSKTMAVFDATGIRNGGGKMTALDVHRKLLPHLDEMTQFQQSEYWCRVSELLSETSYIEYKGKKFYKIDCIVQGLILHPKESAAWMALGEALIRHNVTSYEIHGSTYTPQSCIIKGLESYSDNPIPGPELIYLYSLLARTMHPPDTIILKKQKLTKNDLLLKILESQLESATQWHEFGVAMERCQVMFQDTLYTQTVCCTKAALLAPEQPNYWNELGRSLITSGGKVEIEGEKWGALECFKRALALDCKQPKIWSNLGVALLHNHNATTPMQDAEIGAKQCFINALRLDEKESTAWDGLALFLRNGDSLQHADILWPNITALECYQRALDFAPRENLAQIWSKIGSLLLDGQKVLVQGKEYNAKECLLRALELDPKQILAWSGLIHHMDPKATIKFQGRKITRIECALEVVKIDPKETMGWFCLASDMDAQSEILVNGLPYTQMSCILQALRSDPKSAKAWHLLGSKLSLNQTVDLMDRSWNQMDCYLEALLSNSKDNGKTWKALGEALNIKDLIVHLSLGSISKASCFHQAVQQNPQDIESWVALGDCLTANRALQDGDLDTVSATSCYLKALTHGWTKEPERLWIAIGDTLSETDTVLFQGKTLYACDCYFKALEVSPKQALLWKKVGFFLADHPALKKAHSWKDCLAHSLSYGDRDVAIWEKLAEKMTPSDTITVSNKKLNWMGCAQRLLEQDPSSMIGWYTLATRMNESQSITIQNELHHRDQCSHKMLSNSKAKDWIWLGKRLHPNKEIVLGLKQYKQDDCYFQATKCNPSIEDWVALGDELSQDNRRLGKYGTVSASDCYLEALNLDLDCAPAWKGFKKVNT